MHHGDDPDDDGPEYDTTFNERPGDFGTAHVIHDDDAASALYLPADEWTVHDLDGPDSDDDGNIHYYVRSLAEVDIDYEHHTVRPAAGDRVNRET